MQLSEGSRPILRVSWVPWIREAGQGRYIAWLPSGFAGSPPATGFQSGKRSICEAVEVQPGPSFLRTISVWPRLVNASEIGTKVG